MQSQIEQSENKGVNCRDQPFLTHLKSDIGSHACTLLIIGATATDLSLSRILALFSRIQSFYELALRRIEFQRFLNPSLLAVFSDEAFDEAVWEFEANLTHRNAA